MSKYIRRAAFEILDHTGLPPKMLKHLLNGYSSETLQITIDLMLRGGFSSRGLDLVGRIFELKKGIRKERVLYVYTLRY